MRRDWFPSVALFFAATLLAARAEACPFCAAVEPTLSQTADEAQIVALAEVLARDPQATRLQIVTVRKGQALLGGREELALRPADVPHPAGSLCLLFGAPPEADDKNEAATKWDGWRWKAIAVNETSSAYFFRAPATNRPAAERLRYFARYLEHAEPLLAADAYAEFGHATFDAVLAAADALPQAELRAWIVAESIPPRRKGFYGLALGLALDPAVKRSNLALLRQLIDRPADDFREGFDGLLGGLLWADPDTGLPLIETRFLVDPKAREGDVRHALTALRFFAQYGPPDQRTRVAPAVRRLLERPAFAAAAVTDLARWQDWTVLDRVAALYRVGPNGAPEMNQAVIGYLKAAPAARGEPHLARLRQADPEAVSDYEAYFSRLIRAQ